MYEGGFEEEIKPELDRYYESVKRRARFIEWLRAAEMHWFFVQGIQAIEQGLYLPGVASLINGVEASVRVTMRQTEGVNLLEDPDLGATLSNSLLRRAGEAGLPVKALVFPGEDDFMVKLRQNKTHVEIVRLRHDLAHGNILEFVNKELGPANAFFTPESLRELSNTLIGICERWAESLGHYRDRELGR